MTRYYGTAVPTQPGASREGQPYLRPDLRPARVSLKDAEWCDEAGCPAAKCVHCKEASMTTVTRFQTRRRETGYVYENDCGAIVAERVLLNRTSGYPGWRVRLFTGPDEWGSWYGVDRDEAESMCLNHAAKYD